VNSTVVPKNVTQRQAQRTHWQEYMRSQRSTDANLHNIKATME
jgi:hypothetical protein